MLVLLCPSPPSLIFTEGRFKGSWGERMRKDAHVLKRAEKEGRWTWLQVLRDAQSGVRRRKCCLPAFDSFLGFPAGSVVEKPPAMQDMWVGSLGLEDPPEKEMAVQSSILDWEIPRTEEPVGLQSMGSQRVRRDWVTRQLLLVCMSSSGCFHPVLMSVLYKTLAEWLSLNRILCSSG